MSTEQNKAISVRVFEEIWNKGNLALIEELYSPRFVQHETTGDLHGIENWRRFVKAYLTAFPDLHYTIEDMVAEDDRVVTHFTMRGTHRGVLHGIPPTGERIKVTGMVVARVADGKYEESWGVLDALGMLQQIGIVRGA